MAELFFLVLSISTTIFVILESKRSKKRMEKYIEECNARIEFFKNNTRLTDELENLWTAVAYDKYGVYMRKEDNNDLDL